MMTGRLASLTMLGLALIALVAGGARAVNQRRDNAATASNTNNLTNGLTTGAQPADLKQVAIPLKGQPDDYDQLLEIVGDARFVLLGEATHGTHEFYHERARITQRLIEEKGFVGVAIEGDWADAARVNRYIQGRGADTGPEQALANFTRFPRWMWGNTDIRDLVAWLRAYNHDHSTSGRRIGFYGLDLYNLADSAAAVVSHLERTDAEAAKRARERYQCFDGFQNDPLRYGRATSMELTPSCEAAVEAQFQELQTHVASPIRRLDSGNLDDYFDALQNARVVKNAEHYYRTLYTGANGWNMRDEHMTEMLEALAEHLGTPGKPGKVVVWAHNTHTGDARATELGERGDYNIGQLMRQRYPDEAVLLGFTTYTGTVIAAPEWDAPGELKQVVPALQESYSGLFHSLGLGDFLLPLDEQYLAPGMLREPQLERAIGVIYLPQTERQSHYFEAHLSQQFDAVIHIDESSAVEPLQP